MFYYNYLLNQQKWNEMSPAASYVQRWAPFSNRPANVQVPLHQGKVLQRSYRNNLTFPLLSCESRIFVKGNPNRKIMITRWAVWKKSTTFCLNIIGMISVKRMYLKRCRELFVCHREVEVNRVNSMIFITRNIWNW